MQVKVIIGTIAFMLAMVILGLATLLEPSRLEETTDAYLGRQIENGAQLFRNSCVECHGVEGKAEQCVDFAGEAKGCVGRPINHVPLLCGDPSERMVQLSWSSSKDALIRQTIAAGRPGTLMPTWSNEYGGPMEPHEIDELTAYIMNWAADPALCGEGAVVEQVEWPDSWTDLPEGDAEAGAQAYGSQGCVGCHGDPAAPAEDHTGVGPYLGNIANDAATRIDGMEAQQYIYESILDPNSFIAPECPSGPCNEPSVMLATFGTSLDQQQMADLIAYYMTLEGG